MTVVPQLIVLKDTGALADAAAAAILDAARTAVTEHGRFTIALAGLDAETGLVDLRSSHAPARPVRR